MKKKCVESKMTEDFEKKRSLRGHKYNDTNDAGDTGADTMADGGLVMRSGKQAFHALRSFGGVPGMADGGPLVPLVAKTPAGQAIQNRAQVIENAVNPQQPQNITPPMPAAPAAPAMPVDPLTAQLEAKARLRAAAPPQPAPKKGLFGLGVLGLADGGSPWQQDYKAGGALSRLAAPAPVAPLPVNPMTGTPIAGAAPQPQANPPVAASPLHSMASFNVKFDTTQAPTVGEDMANQWNNGVVGQKTGPGGYPMGLRGGGKVTGPGGPTDDKIPAMLSAGEYVLPADTVQAVGKENLDNLRAQTHTPVAAKGLRHYATGGSVPQLPAPEEFPPVGDYSVSELQPEELSRSQQLLRAARSNVGAATNTATGVGGRVAGLAARAIAPVAVGAGIYNTVTENPQDVKNFNASVGAPEGGVLPTVARGLRNIGDAATLGGASYLGRGLSNVASGSPWSTPGAIEKATGTPVNPPTQKAPVVAPQPAQPNLMGSAPETQVGTTPIPPAINPGITKGLGANGPIYSGSNIQDTSDASQNAAAQGWANIHSEQARFAAKDAQDAQERAANQTASAAQADRASIDRHYDDLAMRVISSLKDNPHQQVAMNNQLAALEAARNAAHHGLASDVTARRGQDIGLQEAGLRAGLEGKRIGIEAQRANQEGAFQRGELGLRGQQLALTRAQYGNTLEEQGMTQLKGFADNQFPKGQEEDNANFTQHVLSGDARDSKGRPWSIIPPQDKGKALSDMKVSYDLTKAANEEGTSNMFGAGKVTNAPFEVIGKHELGWNDIKDNVSLKSYFTSRGKAWNPVNAANGLYNTAVKLADGRSVLLGKLVEDPKGGINLQRLNYINAQLKAHAEEPIKAQ